MEENALSVVVSLIKKQNGHGDKIGRLQELFGLDFAGLEVCLIDEILDLIGVKRDKAGEHSCGDGVYDCLFLCGEDESKIIEFVSRLKAAQK